MDAAARRPSPGPCVGDTPTGSEATRIGCATMAAPPRCLAALRGATREKLAPPGAPSGRPGSTTCRASCETVPTPTVLDRAARCALRQFVEVCTRLTAVANA